MKKIRFNSSDERPKPYGLLILFIVFAAAVVLGYFLNSAWYFAITLTVFAILLIVMLYMALVKQLEYNPYSYNTAYYIGYILFALYLLIVGIIELKGVYQYPEYNQSFAVVGSIATTATSFIFYLSPFVLIMGLSLTVTNLALIRYEGRGWTNLLGALFSLALAIGEILLFWGNFYASGSTREVMIHDMIMNSCAAVLLYLFCLMIGVIIATYIA